MRLLALAGLINQGQAEELFIIFQIKLPVQGSLKDVLFIGLIIFPHCKMYLPTTFAKRARINLPGGASLETDLAVFYSITHIPLGDRMISQSAWDFSDEFR